MGVRSNIRVGALRLDRRVRGLVAGDGSPRPTTPATPPPSPTADVAPTAEAVDEAGHTHAVDFSQLQADGRLHRDSRLGGMFHAGQVSLREDAPKGSLHISIRDGNRVSVHVDRFSPLAERRMGRRRGYSVLRVIVHNVGIVWDYVILFVTRRFGEQRCELECEQVCSDEHELDAVEASEPKHEDRDQPPETPVPIEPPPG